ncbi:MAG: hypothetical protein H0X37_13715 [Herpetosiphonaceae bacterium]|nr:hypothetical protein [Herpetosiphonaceae bacterium]
MIERVCPVCGHGNAVEEPVCTACGAAWAAQEQPLARRPQHALAQRWQQLPPRWQTAAKALALGATAVALEVGTALLRDQQHPNSTALARRPDEAPKLRVIQRRVWRTYRNGTLERETLEETQWFDR